MGEGHALNSVVHLLTRPHENPSLDIDQDLLLERVLRKHPDVIGVGEMRSAKEALSVAESSRTGHTVVTTIHSNSSESTYRRMMTLAKRKYNMADEILMQIMVEAIPSWYSRNSWRMGAGRSCRSSRGRISGTGSSSTAPFTSMM